MDPGITTIVAASVAVIGTLLSPILTHRITARTRLQEHQFGQEARRQERDSETARLEFLERRNVYTRLNAEMRKYHAAMRKCLYEIQDRPNVRPRLSKATEQELNEIRQNYMDQYAAAQMIVSEKVLRLSGHANGGLAPGHGMVLRLAEISSGQSESHYDDLPETVDTAFEYLEDVRMRVARLRDLMRVELGVASGHPASPDHMEDRSGD